MSGDALDVYELAISMGVRSVKLRTRIVTSRLSMKNLAKKLGGIILNSSR